MSKSWLYAILLLLTGFGWAVAALGQAPSAEDNFVAIANSVVQPMMVLRNGQTQLTALQKADRLYPGDRLICQSGGYASIVFADNAVELQLYPGCNLLLQGHKTRHSLFKQVLLQAGRMMTLVFSGSMEVITPNSIASVKGTRWWTIIESPMETKIVVLEGEVSVKNLASQAEQIVQVGQTAVSKSDGVIEISATKADEVPSEPTEQQGSSLEIEFQSDSGQTKTVRIEY